MNRRPVPNKIEILDETSGSLDNNALKVPAQWISVGSLGDVNSRSLHLEESDNKGLSSGPFNR